MPHRDDFRQIRRLIADTLNIRHHFHGCGYGSQIPCHRLLLQRAYRRIAHLACNSGGHEPDGFKQAGHIGHIARHHDDCHGLSDGAAYTKHDGRCNAAFGRRNTDAKVGFQLCCAQRL